MPDGIVIADSHGRILYLNQLAEELSGYQREELVGLTVETLVPERHRGAHLDHRAGYESKPHARPMGSGLALQLLRKDGIEHPVDIALSPIETEVGRIIVTAIRVATDRAVARGRAVDRLQAIADVTSAILEGQTGDQALRLIADVARRLVGATQAGVATPQSPGGPMVVRAAVGGLGDAAVGMRASTELARVMDSGRTTMIAEAASDQRLDYPELTADLGPALIVPLKAGSRPIGAISVARGKGAPAYTEEDVSVAEAFAAQAAVVLEYARNVAERQKAERRLAAGMEVTLAIIEGRETTDVLQLIAARARDLAGAAFAAIASPEPDGNDLVASVADGEQADLYRGRRLPVGSSLTGHVFTTRQSVTVADAAGDARTYQPVLQLGNFGPALIVPMYVANRSMGAMIVANPSGGAAFSPEDLSLVESFAAQAAMSLEIATVRERLQRLTGVTIADQKPLEDALSALSRTVVEATDTIACGIFLLDAERRLTTAGTHGLPAGFISTMDRAYRDAGARLPQMYAIESGTPVVREGAISRFLSNPPSGPLWEPALEMLRGVSWDSIVSVPLIHQGRVVGALSGYYPRGYRLSDAETAFLKIVADHAAAIAENARLFTDAQAHVALEERQRLARELHDSISQSLFGIALGARTAREHLDRDPSAARAPLEYVLQLAEAGMAEMRALIFELRPESLEKEGLVGALAKQAAALRARHGITVDEVVDAEPEAPVVVKEALFRIAQEALNNIAKHARASHVELRLTSSGEALVAEIRDDGAGFDSGAQFPGHLGLQSMQERASRLGGNVQIISSGGQGTIVRATIPRRVDS
jgi:PAS domain S-box-containing protein